MARYRCYFIGSNGQLVAAETIESEGDEEAAAVADRLFAEKAHATGFDLRLGTRQIRMRKVEGSKAA